MEKTLKNRFGIMMQILLAGLCSDAAVANSPPSANILVTATRINSGAHNARGHTTVITAEAIGKSTARTLPELLGRTEAQQKHEYLYWMWAIRVGKWKLHRRGKDRFALYDLENDIGETKDLADKRPEVVARCSKYFDEATR